MSNDMYFESELTKQLDKLLDSARLSNQIHAIKEPLNFMVSGLTGSGKTSAVLSWAKHNNINIVRLNANFYATCQSIIDTNKTFEEDGFFLNTYGKLTLPDSVLVVDDFQYASEDVRNRFIYPIMDTHTIIQNKQKVLLKGLLFVVVIKTII